MSFKVIYIIKNKDPLTCPSARKGYYLEYLKDVSKNSIISAKFVPLSVLTDQQDLVSWGSPGQSS